LPAPGDKHIGPFLYEALGRCQADPAVAPCDYRYLAVKCTDFASLWSRRWLGHSSSRGNPMAVEPTTALNLETNMVCDMPARSASDCNVRLCAGSSCIAAMAELNCLSAKANSQPTPFASRLSRESWVKSAQDHWNNRQPQVFLNRRRWRRATIDMMQAIRSAKSGGRCPRSTTVAPYDGIAEIWFDILSD
jgi:hypothetical protein